MPNRRRLEVGKLLIEIRRPSGEIVARDHYADVEWEGEDGRAILTQVLSTDSGETWGEPMWLSAGRRRLFPSLCGRRTPSRPCKLLLGHDGECA